MSLDLDAVLETAREAARAAANVHRASADRVTIADAEEKGRSDYVSRVDLDAERAARAAIERGFPDHRFLAEESTDPDTIDERALEGPVWIIDPLDGTANFLHGHPMYASSVALAVDGHPVVGVVESAPLGHTWWGARGRGAFVDDRPLRVSSLDDLAHAMIGTGFPFKRERLIDAYRGQLGRVLANTAGVRRGGSAALDLCFTAQGIFAAFWELHLNPWDFAAGVVLVEEAGGVTGRVEGGALALTPGTVLAANTRSNLEALRSLVT